MISYVVFGALFGFVLSRTGATQYDAIHRMFLLEDLHIAGVMAVAIGLSAAAFWALRHGLLHVRGGAKPNLSPKPMQRRLILGAALFGVGWGISGTCPGTALAQIGEGTLAGLVTFAGILIGARLQSWYARREARRTSAVS